MALDVVSDISLLSSSLAKLASLEPPLQLYRNPEVALFGRYALFLRPYCPNRGPGTHRLGCLSCSYLARLFSVLVPVGSGSATTGGKF